MSSCKLFKSKADYSFLHVFWCLWFTHLRPFKAHKFSFRYEPYVFLGYYLNYYGYKCLSSSGRDYISRNVVFHETTFPFADHTDPFFVSSSPKSSTTSKPFVIPCDPSFQPPTAVPEPYTQSISPYMCTSNYSFPFAFSSSSHKFPSPTSITHSHHSPNS